MESTNGQSKTDDQPVDTDGNPKQGSVHSLKVKYNLVILTYNQLNSIRIEEN